MGPLGVLLGFLFWPFTSLDYRVLSFVFPLSFLSFVLPVSCLSFRLFLALVLWNEVALGELWGRLGAISGPLGVL